ncbi:putative RNA-binding protein 1 [Cocos nucifera]|uniref:Putative RNA-binding protein 1 n=1 Tax=Cocos nucifera TaxID=13894 RepID=A0A8K0MW89_COCNU|nr:putative RNA-binding protein 1 [Cocos nucifera]
MRSAGDPRGASDFLRSDISIQPGSYGSDDLSGAGSRATPGFSGLAAVDQSNILFVDGLPPDCSRREVARILVAVSH